MRRYLLLPLVIAASAAACHPHAPQMPSPDSLARTVLIRRDPFESAEISW